MAVGSANVSRTRCLKRVVSRNRADTEHPENQQRIQQTDRCGFRGARRQFSSVGGVSGCPACGSGEQSGNVVPAGALLGPILQPMCPGCSLRTALWRRILQNYDG